MKKLINIVGGIAMIALLFGILASCNKKEPTHISTNSISFSLNDSRVMQNQSVPLSAIYDSEKRSLEISATVSSNGIRYVLSFTVPEPSDGLSTGDTELVKFRVANEDFAEISNLWFFLKDFKLYKKSPSYVTGSFKFNGTFLKNSSAFFVRDGEFDIKLTKK